MKFLATLLLLPAFAWGQATVLGTGLVVKGPIGGFGGCAYGSARPDGTVEFANCTMGKSLIVSLFNVDPVGESGISFGGALNTGQPFQQVGIYSRYVNSNNGYGWMGVLGVHVVGHDIGQGGDSTDALFYPRNAVKLCAGPTTSTVHNYPAPPNTVEFGAGADTGAPVGCGLLLHDLPAHPAPIAGATRIYTLAGVTYVMPPSGTPKQIAP